MFGTGRLDLENSVREGNNSGATHWLTFVLAVR